MDLDLQGIIADRAAVATPHPQAAIAAKAILQNGGNAADAAVGAILTLCVVTPSQVGLGGFGGNFVAYLASQKKVVCLDFDSRAPLAYHDGLISGPKESLLGYKAITVPAVVAGLDAILREYGTKSWREVAEHALDLAENGFDLDPILKSQMDTWSTKTNDVSRQAIFPDGKIPPTGTRIIQKDVARLIRRIGEEGIDCFYRGDIARKIVETTRAHGGVLSEEDFAQYKPQRMEALSIAYRGHEIFTPPPPSGGISAFQILKVLEHFDLSNIQPFSAEYFHIFTEATKLCWQDRIDLVGDPDFVKIPIEQMLSDSGAAQKADQIKFAIVRNTKRITDHGPHTANVCIADPHGNLVSMTATQGFLFGSQMVIEGLGLVMNHGISRFDFIPNHPNAPAPGKRMCHNMAPTIALRNGKPVCAVGLPGGAKIVTVTAQLLVDLIDFHSSAPGAVMAPRIHCEGDEPVAVSSKVKDETIAKLKQIGHQIVRGQTVGGPPGEIAGTANVLSINDAGRIAAASGGGDNCVAGIP